MVVGYISVYRENYTCGCSSFEFRSFLGERERGGGGEAVEPHATEGFPALPATELTGFVGYFLGEQVSRGLRAIDGRRRRRLFQRRLLIADGI